MSASTIALVEVDNAGEVFAELGQNAMELFLAEFKHRISRFMRGCDELIEVQPTKLCVVLNNVTETVQIELAGAKLNRLFEAPIAILDEEIKARVHAAFVPPAAAQDSRSGLKLAESALHDARRRNRFFVIQQGAPKTDMDPMRRSREIELAFERGEFVLYFQPVVHAGRRNVISAEALMRWHDPAKGVRLPAEFIPYLGQSAVLKSLTWFSLKSAIAQASTWPVAASVAVNVSPELLQDSGLLPNVADALSIFGMAAERLTLEITEDAMVEDPEGTTRVLAQLRDLGVKVAIDDFGTGYSSLAAFRDLPVDILKIDRSFVASMLEHPRDNDIVRSIIDLAHTFQMQVVAEGVEDDETACALAHLGADLLQGFQFGRPMQAAEFVRLLS